MNYYLFLFLLHFLLLYLLLHLLYRLLFLLLLLPPLPRQDCNDQCPSFVELEAETEVREDLLKGSEVYKCDAKDADKTAPNNEIT